MAHQELVSVIIPCFNYGRYLNECIESLVRQSYGKWEAIIVDDGSSDETETVGHALASKDARVRYLRIQNAGVAIARNTGIEASKGTYLLALDADDLLRPAALEKMVKVLLRDKQIGFVYSALDHLDGLPGEPSGWHPGIFSRS